MKDVSSLANPENPYYSETIHKHSKELVEVSADKLIEIYFDVLGESIQYLGLDKYQELMLHTLQHKL